MEGKSEGQSSVTNNRFVPSITGNIAQIPPELSLSKLPWEKIEEKVENLNRKVEPDRDDEFALRADFTNNTPNLETVKRRAKYRPNLWFNLIPRDQRYWLFMTYGPAEQGYDVDSEQIGIEFFGAVETLEQAGQQIEAIRHYNPHAVFLTIHVVDIGSGKRIDLPPKSDGGTQSHYVNKMHGQIMSKYLNNSVSDQEELEDRITNCISDVKDRNQLVTNYNKKLENHAKTLLNMNTSEIKKYRTDAKKRLLESLEPFPESLISEKLDINPDQRSVKEQLENGVKTLVYEQVENFVNLDKELNPIVSPGYRAIYRHFVDENGKQVLVRTVQHFEQ
jgi:hypothetical protein